MSSRRGPRESKAVDRKMVRFAQLVEAGATIYEASRAVGLPVSTYRSRRLRALQGRTLGAEST